MNHQNGPMGILCANLRGARLFRADRDGVVQFVREFGRPRVRTRDADFPNETELSEVISDPVVQQEEQVALRYAKHLNHLLQGDLSHHRFESLVICAEPKLLGILISSFSEGTKNAISGIVEQDLYEVNETDLMSYVRDLKRDPHQRAAA